MNLETIREALAAKDGRAMLFHPRLLRRVILVDRAIRGAGFFVPHKLSYLLSRERLQQIVSSDELPTAVSHDTVLLIAEPSERDLEKESSDSLLRKYWRYLFHLRVHEEVDRKIMNGTVSPRDFFKKLPERTVGEIRNVLQDDKYLLPPGDDATLLTEFAAVYLELRAFTPELLGIFFPSLEGLEDIDQEITSWIDPNLLEECRLADAQIKHQEKDKDGPGFIKRGLPRIPKWLRSHFQQRAEKAEALGNSVRSIVLRARTLWGNEEESKLQAPLEAFVLRLERSLKFSLFRAKAWVEALMPVARSAKFGLVAQECRFLFDLQRVCLDAERTTYSVNLFPWILSLGRVPLRRALPHEQKARTFRRLGRAFRRIPTLRLNSDEREKLEGLIAEALRTSEEDLRASFRPIINDAIQMGGLSPRNAPERFALNKLTEELLDRIVANGYTTLGDLRDAVSRNDLKLPDLQTPYELVGGDPLLRIDSNLAKMLDGVYRRGEVYLRVLQGFTSLLFAVPFGRLLTRFVFMPFGGSYLLLSGLQHVFGEWERRLTGVPIELDTPINVIGVGIPIAFLVNSSRAREIAGSFFKGIGNIFRLFFVELPRFLLKMPLIQQILDYMLFRYLIQFLVKPLIVTCIVWILLPKVPSLSSHDPFKVTAIFLGLVALFNSRWWAKTEEMLIDWITRSWRWFRRDFLQGLFDSIMELFREVTTISERFIYYGDEILRFRSGEGSWLLVFKAIFGTLWSIISYLTRFAIRLLLEPQVNPIKHFPVVTVSHKLLLPTIPLFIEPLRALGYTKPEAIGLATTVIFCIPGIFGFLVWELRENWRLYEANRKRLLSPVHVDDHGHSIPNLLLPGFHSGVIPKIFRRLRALWRKEGARASRRRERLDHKLEATRVAIARFASRLFLFEEEGMPKGLRLKGVRITTNSAAISIGFGEEEKILTITVYSLGHKLAAEVAGLPSLYARFSEEEKRIFGGILEAFYSWSGVSVICHKDSTEKGGVSFSPLSWNSWLGLWEKDESGLRKRESI